jgi:D-tyrosyl-tRNA(Tyr) deacylase
MATALQGKVWHHVAMKCVIQRVRRASVAVGEEMVAEIGAGMLLLVAIEKGDTEDTLTEAAKKIRKLRIFGDEQGKMNRDLGDTGGSILAVSQFTLAGSLARGRRPSFDNAEEPGRPRELFDRFVAELGVSGIAVKTGRFREMMVVALENDGPVTFVYP